MPAQSKRHITKEHKVYTAKIVARYFYAGWIRALHWFRALLFVWFIASGFYLAYPYLAPNLTLDTSHNFIQAQVRGLHVLAGIILLGMTIGRVYYFMFLTPDGRLGFSDEFRQLKVLFDREAWIENLKFYFLTWNNPHPPKYMLKYYYGPLQALSYLLFYTALALIIATGLLLAAPYQERGLAGDLARLLEPMLLTLGGLAKIRVLHYWLTWFFIVFIVVHVYILVWNSIRTRTLRSEVIISGFRILEGLEEPLSEEDYDEAIKRLIQENG